MAIATDEATIGIRAVSERTGLSLDTLRWYEKEGLLPPVDRSPDGRRAYSAASLGFLELIQALRRTGMPVADVRAFVRLLDEGAASHGRRMTLLEQQRAAIQRQIGQHTADLATVECKIAHYRELIDRGLDCAGAPVDQATVAAQRQLS
ncbi:MerR family transcriptional regulator [Micromonospora sp. DT47]|uniref:MerR family transcriptional regulator n=1 Tax=Micromonospora sp. DT47 TaxID=3393431 RepID=UPI003CF3F298